MMKKTSFVWSKPLMHIERATGKALSPVAMDLPPTITLRVEKPAVDGSRLLIAVGDSVATGQRVQVYENPSGYGIAPATGSVTGMSTTPGDYGRQYLDIIIDTREDQWDDQFAGASETPDMDTLKGFLLQTPGMLPLDALDDPERPLQTLVVNGVDQDLMAAVRQHVVTTDIESVAEGIQILKTATGIDDVRIALPRDTIQNVGSIGAAPVGVDTTYPAGHPKLIMADVLNTAVPAGRSCEDLGTCFISAEAVAAIGRAFETRRLPVHKLVTVVAKDGKRTLMKTRLGTAVQALLDAVGITVDEGDRVILGGPMTGSAIYDLKTPVEPGTDMIFVQDHDDIPEVSDFPCVNCGDCIRICPTRVPVNMLVRFLEAGQYDTAADEYDLFSCIECGLCTFVCIAHIPILQYISLAKHEIARIQQSEEADV